MCTGLIYRSFDIVLVLQLLTVSVDIDVHIVVLCDIVDIDNCSYECRYRQFVFDIVNIKNKAGLGNGFTEGGIPSKSELGTLCFSKHLIIK